jgi:hypothetical protein
MSEEQIDELCRESLDGGFPLCPWIGTAHYEAHWARKRLTAVRQMKESVLATKRSLEVSDEQT